MQKQLGLQQKSNRYHIPNYVFENIIKYQSKIDSQHKKKNNSIIYQPKSQIYPNHNKK